MAAGVRRATLRGGAFALDFVEKETRAEQPPDGPDGEHECGVESVVWLAHRLFACRIEDDDGHCRTSALYEQRFEGGDEGPSDLSAWKKSGGTPRITDEGSVVVDE